jgi:hypothetical protein
MHEMELFRATASGLSAPAGGTSGGFIALPS